MAISDKQIAAARRRMRSGEGGNPGGGETESQAQQRKLKEWNENYANPKLSDVVRKYYNKMQAMRKK